MEAQERDFLENMECLYRKHGRKFVVANFNGRTAFSFRAPSPATIGFGKNP